MRGAVVARAILVTAALALAPVASWAQRDERASDEANETPPALTEQGTSADRRAAAQLERLRGSNPVVQAGPVDPARYLLGPGDMLELDLWGRLSQATVLSVSPEGSVFLPGSGPINVSGRTLAWTRQRILDVVAQTFRGVHAEVRLIQLRTFKVYLTGFVEKPGATQVTSVTRASEAVSEVGIAKTGSRRNISIRHRDGTEGRLDLELLENAGRVDLDPVLVDGDVIHVPRATQFITLAGAVERPGTYELAPLDSLSTLMQLGGGVLPAASPEAATMVRFSGPSERESLGVNLDDLMGDRFDPPLRDGDQLFIQYRADFHQIFTVDIYGEVEHPGSYAIVPGRDRFSDLIRWSGGFRPLADRNTIHLLREPPTGAEKDPEFDRLVRLSRGEMTGSEYVKFQTRLAERKNAFRVDWSRIQKESVDIDPLLQPNDVIRVEALVSTVRVEGEVRRPGLVDYAPGRPLKEYIELAGGYTDRAARRDVRISRSLTGQVIPARSLVSIQAGDFVWVPERQDVDAWAVFRDAVAVAGQVAVVVFTLSR